MTASPSLTGQLESIMSAIDDVPPDTLTTCEHFRTLLSNIILPRRVTLRTDAGNRLSVIVRNRRIIALAEVHPASLWSGNGPPQGTVREPTSETFGKPLATLIVHLASEDGSRVEQHFLTDPLPSARIRGYPVSGLAKHLAEASM